MGRITISKGIKVEEMEGLEKSYDKMGRDRKEVFDEIIQDNHHQAVIYTTQDDIDDCKDLIQASKYETMICRTMVMNNLTKFALKNALHPETLTQKDHQNYFHDLLIWRYSFNSGVEKE